MAENFTKVKKAIITTAGWGTRFLPAGKVVPKSLMPIGIYPVIHYQLEECKLSGIEEVALVVQERGSLLEKYFEGNKALESYLEEKGKLDILQKVKDTTLGMKITFIEQNNDLPYGHGRPVLSCKEWANGEPTVVMWNDDLVLGEPAVKEVIGTWEANAGLAGVIGSMEMEPERIANTFGNFELGQELAGEDSWEVASFVEKPPLENVKSNLMSIGRIVVPGDIYQALEEVLQFYTGAKEFELYDGIFHLQSHHNQIVAVRKISGHWYTTGKPDEFLLTANAYAEAGVGMN
jgi:UTP--glucose-1-phosphate uridylyltransferase